VIIGIIAAIAVPRMARGAAGAGEATLRADLRTLRVVIDLYAVEHNGNLPGRMGSPAGFWNRLTKPTNASGSLSPAADDIIYGPYLHGRTAVPVGPNAGVTGVVMTTTSPVSAALDEAQTNRGWVYNYQTGQIIANTDDLDESGVGYDTY
jgi:general secretion pathway protein G